MMTNAKQRIIDLVKEGRLTKEEAVILFENRMDTKALEALEPTDHQDTAAAYNEQQPKDTEQLEKTNQNVQETSVDSQTDLAEISDKDEQGENQASEADQTEEERVAAFYAELNAQFQGTSAEDKAADAFYQQLKTTLEKKRAEKEALEALEETAEQEILLQRVTEEMEQLQEQLAQWRLEHPEPTTKTQKASQNKTTDEADTRFVDRTKRTFRDMQNYVKDTIAWERTSHGIPLPKLKTHAYEKRWTFPGEDLSVITLDLTKGDITVKLWDNPEILMEVRGKLLGDYAEDTAEAAFMNRSSIQYDAGNLEFKLLNRLLTSHVTLYLPVHRLDYVQLHTLTGNIWVDALETNDMHVASYDGDIRLNAITAQMLEIQAKNNPIELTETNVVDLVSKNLNGSQRIIGRFENSEIQTGNGHIRLTYTNTPKRVLAEAMSGDVKVNLPKGAGMDGFAQTKQGHILFRYPELDVQVIHDESLNKQQTFTYDAGGPAVYATLKTIYGNILVKTSKNR